MKYCSNCGTQLNDWDTTCPNCHTAQQAAPAVVDNGGFGWGLLGFCIPLVGLILFLVWRDQKPKTGKAAGVGALVAVILSVVFYAIMFAAGISLAALGT